MIGPVTATPQGAVKGGRGSAGEGELALGKELAQHGTGSQIKRHPEPQVEGVLGVIPANASQGEPLWPWANRLDIDIGKRLIARAIHGNLQTH